MIYDNTHGSPIIFNCGDLVYCKVEDKELRKIGSKFKTQWCVQGFIVKIESDRFAYVCYTTETNFDEQSSGEVSKRKFTFNELEIIDFGTLNDFISNSLKAHRTKRHLIKFHLGGDDTDSEPDSAVEATAIVPTTRKVPDYFPFKSAQTNNRDFGVFMASIVLMRILIQSSPDAFTNTILKLENTANGSASMLLKICYFAIEFEKEENTNQFMETNLLALLKRRSQTHRLEQQFQVETSYNLHQFLQILTMELNDEIEPFKTPGIGFVKTMRISCKNPGCMNGTNTTIVSAEVQQMATILSQSASIIIDLDVEIPKTHFKDGRKVK